MATLYNELVWFSEVLENRLQAYFQHEQISEMTPPDLTNDHSVYGSLVTTRRLSPDERLIMMLVISPNLKPELLDPFFTKNSQFERGFTEFGGYLGKYHGGFLPTIETALFLLSAGDLARRVSVIEYFDPEHLLVKEGILEIREPENMEPFTSSPISISPSYLKYLLTGEMEPESYVAFPARKIETKLEWSDLVIDKEVREDIEQMKSWIQHGEVLMEDLGLAKKVKPGYRCLFYGPPGTGKTLTACLLGKETGLDVYRIDLSLIVSKYIGETEKNLSRIFDKAERNKWILFFDEADALFGKRTQASTANDRFANQEVSYLLQRVEDYSGIIILASNLKSNMDDAFSRRFQSTIYFGMPNAQNRLAIWTKIFSGSLPPESGLSLKEIAQEYEISGGSAINIYRYGAIKAMQRGSRCILKSDIIKGIQKEFQKEGKTI